MRALMDTLRRLLWEARAEIRHNPDPHRCNPADHDRSGVPGCGQTSAPDGERSTASGDGGYD